MSLVSIRASVVDEIASNFYYLVEIRNFVVSPGDINDNDLIVVNKRINTFTLWKIGGSLNTPDKRLQCDADFYHASDMFLLYEHINKIVEESYK